MAAHTPTHIAMPQPKPSVAPVSSAPVFPSIDLPTFAMPVRTPKRQKSDQRISTHFATLFNCVVPLEQADYTANEAGSGEELLNV